MSLPMGYTTISKRSKNAGAKSMIASVFSLGSLNLVNMGRRVLAAAPFSTKKPWAGWRPGL
jgi:hypothetical protein